MTSMAALEAAAAAGEARLAIREGVLLAPRVVPLRQAAAGPLVPPPGPSAEAALAPRQVRIEMRAAGLNFRDVLVALGFYPARPSRRRGRRRRRRDRRRGRRPRPRGPGHGPDRRTPSGRSRSAERDLLAPIPAGWSFEQAAAMPIVFPTALYGLDDLAGLKAGERVLIHAGAGGVGMAAIQIAQPPRRRGLRHRQPGASGTALREAGIDDDHIASSRDLEFKERFLAATGGEGVDVVLNSLAGEFVDASLELLAARRPLPGDGQDRHPRPRARSPPTHPGVAYRAFDLARSRPASGPARCSPRSPRSSSAAPCATLPIATWDMRRAPQAFRHLREGRNVGKVVLDRPPADRPRAHRPDHRRHRRPRRARRPPPGRAPRRPPPAAGQPQRRRGRGRRGAAGRARASWAPRSRSPPATSPTANALEELLASIPDEHPLGAVIHAAGVLDDAHGRVAGRRAARARLRPQGRRRLAPARADRATLDLSAFVLFSSAAGTLGGPGQAQLRRRQRLPRRARAEAPRRGPARHLDRLGALGARERHGLAPRRGRPRADAAPAASSRSPTSEGLELFDAALDAERPLVLATRAATANALRDDPPTRSAPAERERDMLELVRGEAAEVLGAGSGDAVPADAAFKDLGFDSLAAVELRNRLSAATGLTLDAGLAFEHPTPIELAEHIRGLIGR